MVDLPTEPQVSLCLRAGFLALRHIADFFGIPYNPDPEPGDPISIERAQFDAACEELNVAGLPIKADREQAWHDFSGWRVNYDAVLAPLARLTAAPQAFWLLPGKDAQGPFNSPKPGQLARHRDRGGNG